MNIFLTKLLYKVINLKHYQRNRSLLKKVDALRNNQKTIQYNDHPRVTAIVQFFNKRHNIPGIIQRLRASEFEEIIVIDDGSLDGSYEDWVTHLTQPNDFLLRCNDIFEVRTYDRAIRMARGEYVCLLQDDDLPPASNDWVTNALLLFDSLPNLLILGGNAGIDPMMPDPIPPNGSQAYHAINGICGCPGINKHRSYRKPLYNENKTNLPFMFTTAVNRAPVFIKRQPLIDLGGIDQAYAPFQFDDDDLCVRAWLAGYQVGLYSCSFVRDVGRGGMRIYNKERIDKQVMINANKFYQTYSDIIENGELQQLIDEANQSLNSNLNLLEKVKN